MMIDGRPLVILAAKSFIYTDCVEFNTLVCYTVKSDWINKNSHNDCK